MLLTAAALATQRIRLGTLVTPVARRRLSKLAREVTTLDRLTGGRMILGAGLGAPIGRDLLGRSATGTIWKGAPGPRCAAPTRGRPAARRRCQRPGGRAPNVPAWPYSGLTLTSGPDPAALTGALTRRP